MTAVDDETLNAHRLADVTVEALQVEESRFIRRGLEAAGFVVPRESAEMQAALNEANRAGYRWMIRAGADGTRFGELVGPAGPVPGSPRVQYPSWWRPSARALSPRR